LVPSGAVTSTTGIAMRTIHESLPEIRHLCHSIVS